MGVAKDTLNLSVTNPTFPWARETNFILQMGDKKGEPPRGVLTQVHFYSMTVFPSLKE